MRRSELEDELARVCPRVKHVHHLDVPVQPLLHVQLVLDLAVLDALCATPPILSVKPHTSILLSQGAHATRPSGQLVCKHCTKDTTWEVRRSEPAMGMHSAPATDGLALPSTAASMGK